MLLKTAGIILVIFSCSALGLSYGRGLNMHLEELRFLKELYQRLWGEIQYTKEPFPEVLLEISNRVKEPYASLFSQAHQAFEEQGNLHFPRWFRMYASKTLDSYRKEKHLSDEEWNQFLALGSQTGYLDFQMQIGMLKLAGERWDMWIQASEAEIGPKKRIGTCLGVFGGVFLSILLL